MGLTLVPPPLLQTEGELPPLCSCSGTWCKVGEPLKEAHGCTPDHSDTKASPYLPHYPKGPRYPKGLYDQAYKLDNLL